MDEQSKEIARSALKNMFEERVNGKVLQVTDIMMGIFEEAFFAGFEFACKTLKIEKTKEDLVDH